MRSSHKAQVNLHIRISYGSTQFFHNRTLVDPTKNTRADNSTECSPKAQSMREFASYENIGGNNGTRFSPKAQSIQIFSPLPLSNQAARHVVRYHFRRNAGLEFLLYQLGRRWPQHRQKWYSANPRPAFFSKMVKYKMRAALFSENGKVQNAGGLSSKVVKYNILFALAPNANT